MLRASAFDYDLPSELIAQEPLPDRSASRLLVLERSSGAIRHARFSDVIDLVAAEDVVVLNVSRVIPARLHGKRDTLKGSRTVAGAMTEVLLVRELERSEEHTSELQSRLHLVCRLLLEKKKKKENKYLHSVCI